MQMIKSPTELYRRMMNVYMVRTMNRNLHASANVIIIYPQISDYRMLHNQVVMIQLSISKEW